MNATEIIDWRNTPDRVIDLLGPKVVLSSATVLTRSQLEELEHLSHRPFPSADPEIWRSEFVDAAIQTIRFIVEVAKFGSARRKDKWPTAVRLGMDRNNAVPGHPVIALEPYLLISGSGNYGGEITKCAGITSAEQKRTCLFHTLYALSHEHRSSSQRNRPDMLELTQIADILDDISFGVKESLGGLYHPEHRMLVAYKHRSQGVIMLDGDYSVSRQDTGRSYGAWSPEGGPLI